VQAAESRGPISLYFTPSWPLKAWLFFWEDQATLELDTALAEWRLAEFVQEFVSRLQGRSISFHVLIFGGGTKVAVIPRKAQEWKGSTGSRWQIRSQEVLGWWPVSSEAGFVALDEDSALNSLRAAAPTEKQQRIIVQALRDSGWNLSDFAARPHKWTPSSTNSDEVAYRELRVPLEGTASDEVFDT